MSQLPYQYQLKIMETKPDALDRMDIQFQWGNYGLRVLRCHLVSFHPGEVVPFHEHSEYEFHFIPSGKGKVIMNDESFSLHKGLFYLTGPHVVHYQEADHKQSMEELCLHIDIVKLFDKDDVPADYWGNRLDILEADACMTQLQQLPLRPTFDAYQAMQWFVIAYQAWLDNKLGMHTSIQQAVIQVLLRSVQAYESTHKLEIDASARNMTAHRYALATQFIEDNYFRPLSLDDVASKISISGRQLQRIFTEQTGHTFSNYLENVRLDHICRDLIQTEDPIHDIAARHGFSNSNYLFHVFRKRFGMTPGAYKTMKRKAMNNTTFT